MTTADSATTFAAPHRPLAVRVVNALAAIVPSHPRLDVASVVKASGIADARLDAPEDAMFLDRLQALLADANGAAQLNHVGRWIVRAKLGRIVGNRLRVRQWMREHPGTRDVEVRTPLFIVGQPRTGTTLLYGLLAQDPQARAPRVWEVNAPVPPPKADGLAAAFPDACIMQTHRDPLESIPSLCSLVATVRSASSDRVDLHRVGEATLDWFGQASRRSARARERLAAERFVDIPYATLTADPLGVVRDLYARCGFPFTRLAERRMSDWLAANPQHRHGVHRYTLAQFGLSEDRVRAVAGDYDTRYASCA